MRIPTLGEEIQFHGLAAAALIILILGGAGLWRMSSHRILETSVLTQMNADDFDLQRIETQRKKTLQVSKRTSLAAGILVLIVVFIVSRSLERRLSAPIRTLQRRISQTRLEPGEAIPQGKISGPRELRRLVEAFDQMSARVKLQYGALAHLAETRKRIVFMITHDFGNAMTGLLGGLQLLGDPDELETKDRIRFTAMALESAKSLQRMSEDFIAIIEGTSNAGQFPISVLDLHSVVERAIEGVEYKRAQREIEIKFEAEPVLHPVRANAGILGFILNNLIGNGLKYSSPGGRLTVRLLRRKRQTRVEVEDRGIGMAPEELSAAFAGGFRSAQAQKMASGFGIGLSLVREAVEGHGSHLHAESKPGKGAKFWFDLDNAAATKERDG